MKRLLKSHIALLAWRLALLYAVLAICRAIFWRYNYAGIGPLADAELPALARGALLFDTVSVLYANALLIVLSLIPLHLRERRWWQRMLYFYYVVVNALLVVAVNLGDAVYFRYTQKRFTAEEIFFADNDNSLQLVGKFMAENIPLLLAGIGLIALLALAGGRKARPEPLCRRPLCYYGGGTVLLVVAALLSVAGMRGGVTRMTRPVTLSNATLYASDNARANLILSNPSASCAPWGRAERSTTNATSLRKNWTVSTRPSTVPTRSARHRSKDATWWSSSWRACRPNTRPTSIPNSTPTGRSRATRRFWIRSCRRATASNACTPTAPVRFRRCPPYWDRSPPFKTPFVLMPQALAPTRQLPRILRDKGYATAFFCGSAAGSMGFGAYARSAGIERLYSREDYEARHGRDDFDGYWGIWDESFLQYAGEEMNALPEPFFAALFTLSSHHPFVVPDAYRDLLPEGLTRNHKCVAYTDNAFRRFFARYAGEEWFRRTVFVFVADHVSSEKFADATRVFPGDHHIIGLLYTPDGALRGRYDEAVSQIDLMPTLLGLMGNREPYFAFGRDLFGEQTPEGGFALAYDSGFEAVGGDRLLFFDERRTTGSYRTDDLRREHDLRNDPEAAALERRVKAFVQQYYRHLEQKDFTVE